MHDSPGAISCKCHIHSHMRATIRRTELLRKFGAPDLGVTPSASFTAHIKNRPVQRACNVLSLPVKISCSVFFLKKSCFFLGLPRRGETLGPTKGWVLRRKRRIIARTWMRMIYRDSRLLKITGLFCRIVSFIGLFCKRVS